MKCKVALLCSDNMLKKFILISAHAICHLTVLSVCECCIAVVVLALLLNRFPSALFRFMAHMN